MAAIQQALCPARRLPRACMARSTPVSEARGSNKALRWISSDSPGLRREGSPGRFRYRLPDGRLLRSRAVLARIRALAIPPAWQSVWISVDPSAHLQATGRDQRGRKQYLYHPAWRQQRSEHKFARLPDFGRGLPRLRSQLRRWLESGSTPTRERVLAALVQLLDCSCMRIGNDAYARENGSFGLSTLRCRHLRLQGQALHLRFIGKTGVEHRVSLSDARLAALMRRCRELPGDELFQYLDEEGQTHRISSTDVNAWLLERLGPGMTAKVFRTWHGSVLALDGVLAAALRDEAPEVPAIIRQVAQRLGNTPAVCRASYVHPAVLALADELSRPARRSALRSEPWLQVPRRRGLSLTEARLMAMLEGLPPAPAAGTRARTNA